MQFATVGGGASSAAKLVLAAVVSLLAVGLILLVGAIVTRRGTRAVDTGDVGRAPRQPF